MGAGASGLALPALPRAVLPEAGCWARVWRRAGDEASLAFPQPLFPQPDAHTPVQSWGVAAAGPPHPPAPFPPSCPAPGRFLARCEVWRELLCHGAQLC